MSFSTERLEDLCELIVDCPHSTPTGLIQVLWYYETKIFAMAYLICHLQVLLMRKGSKVELNVLHLKRMI